MPNVLGVYNPLFYANEALILLYKQLGMAGRVHMGYDEERRAFRKGDTINIRKPGTFTAQNAPSSKQDMVTETVSMQLTNWKEVKIGITDKELAYTQERIIEDHIEPAAYALADDIDQALAGLIPEIPWTAAINSPAPSATTVQDILSPRQTLFDNKVPLVPGRIHYMIDGAQENGFLAMPAFSQWQGAGDTGVSTQKRGTLGTKYGIEMFANQNTPSVTFGTASTRSLAVNNAGGYAKGTTAVNLDAVSVTGTLRRGDVISFAGHSQKYAVTATFTAASNAFTGVTISPALQAAVADNEVVTVENTAGASKVQNCMFHRNAFALGFAELSMMGNELGAKVATVRDPFTGLALRSRLWYEADISEVRVALDVLYGVKTLDPNLAVRGLR